MTSRGPHVPISSFFVAFRGSLVLLLRTPRATWRCCSFWPTMRTGAAEQKEDDLTGLASPGPNAGYWIAHKSSINKHKLRGDEVLLLSSFFLRGPGWFDVFWSTPGHEKIVKKNGQWIWRNVGAIEMLQKLFLTGSFYLDDPGGNVWNGYEWLVRWSCPTFYTVCIL